MKKIPTIFLRDPISNAVVDEPNLYCDWVFNGEGVAYRKYNGMPCMIRDGALYKRRTLSAGHPTPDGFILVEVEDGAQIGWIPVDHSPGDRWFREAVKYISARNSHDPVVGLSDWGNGTYELVGPKVLGNPEAYTEHVLLPHVGLGNILPSAPRAFGALREFFCRANYEGLVWHHSDGRMGKIKGRDFGLERGGQG